MSDWKYVQQAKSERLAKLHHFSVMKQHAGGEIELIITVKEYAMPETGHLHFYAETDKLLNQKAAPFRACGWGDSLMSALAECMRNVRRFEYEADDTQQAKTPAAASNC